MQIDQTSLRSLEILRTIRTESKKNSLLESIDQTLTGMGGRMFRGWLCMPLCDVAAIELRQDAVADFCREDKVTADIRKRLDDIADLERIVRPRQHVSRKRPRSGCSCPNAAAGTGHSHRIAELLWRICLRSLLGQCDSMDELADLLEKAIEPECPSHLRDGGVIKTGFDAELDQPALDFKGRPNMACRLSAEGRCSGRASRI